VRAVQLLQPPVGSLTLLYRIELLLARGGSGTRPLLRALQSDLLLP
jgi:hypothetical protein